MPLSPFHWVDYLARGLMIGAGISLCIIVASALAYMTKFVKWAKEEAEFRRDEAALLRAWVGSITARVDRLMARIDLTNFKATTRQRESPVTEEGCVNKSFGESASSGASAAGENPPDGWVREKESTCAEGGTEMQRMQSTQVEGECSHMVARSAAELYENYRRGEAKMISKGLIRGRWRRVLTRTYESVAVQYENGQDAVTFAGWTWDTWEAAEVVPAESTVLEVIKEGETDDCISNGASIDELRDGDWEG